MKETWKDIKGYEGLYEVSDFGRVRHVKYNRYLKPNLHKNKYQRVNLSKNNEQYRPRVHRLVAQAFIPNPENKPEINHIDLNPCNNHVSNLEWVTGEENIEHYQKSDKYKKFLEQYKK